jgi:hypothetical protein
MDRRPRPIFADASRTRRAWLRTLRVGILVLIIAFVLALLLVAAAR